MSQPGVGVVVVTASGLIEYINAQKLKLRAPQGLGLADVVGRRVHDVVPDEVAAAAMEHIRGAATNDAIVLERLLWRGTRVQSQYQSLGPGPDGEARVVVISRRGLADPEPALEPEQFRIVEAGFAHLGPLETLSPRELEVLAYLGEGMRIKEIADAMGRSPKTVQNHRESIGHKLRVADRLGLAQIARDAGLVPGDASLRRLRDPG